MFSWAKLSQKRKGKCGFLQLSFQSVGMYLQKRKIYQKANLQSINFGFFIMIFSTFDHCGGHRQRFGDWGPVLMPLVLFIPEAKESQKMVGTSLCWWVKSAPLPLVKIEFTNLLKVNGKVPICSGGPDSTEFLMLGSNIH